MKTKKEKRTLEFTKETIARLGEGQMKGLIGGTDGGQPSIQVAGDCTLTQGTQAQLHTCNALICRPTK